MNLKFCLKPKTTMDGYGYSIWKSSRKTSDGHALLLHLYIFLMYFLFRLLFLNGTMVFIATIFAYGHNLFLPSTMDKTLYKNGTEKKNKKQ